MNTTRKVTYIVGTALSVCFSALVLSAPVAPPVGQLQYPWSTLPEHCKGKLPVPENCVLEDWTTYDESRAKLIMLYAIEQFTLLERALEEISASTRVLDSGWPLITVNYSGLYNLSPGGKSFDAEELTRIMRWKKRVPNSHFVHIAEATFWVRKAWSLRGSGYANTVSDETWKLFNKYHQDAERILMEAPRKLRDYPTWHHAMISISRNLDSPSRSTEDRFAEASHRWPTYYPFYEITANRIQPKWGSSWRKLESFASSSAAAMGPDSKEGAGLYARIYIYMRNDEALDIMRPDWEKLKRSFEALIANQPKAPTYRNYYASFACAMRDKPAFTRAMNLIDKDTLLRDSWIKGHSHDACVEWAFAKS